MNKAALVCIVEDEIDIRETLKTLFEMEGYEVKTASNGKEALRIVYNLPDFAVFLVDLMMPVMNGWEFIETIREKYSKTELPIIVMSAVVEQAKSLSAKVNAMIKKPIEIDRILNLVAMECLRKENKAA